MQPEVAEEVFMVCLNIWSCLPVGLCNAPSTFQRCVELIFQVIQWKYLLVYLDDIIVIASIFD